jgi:hypothetical protein
VPVSLERKKHGFGRATAMGYYQYRIKVNHDSQEKSRKILGQIFYVAAR